MPEPDKGTWGRHVASVIIPPGIACAPPQHLKNPPCASRVAACLGCKGGERTQLFLACQHRFGRPDTQRIENQMQPVHPEMAQRHVVRPSSP